MATASFIVRNCFIYIPRGLAARAYASFACIVVTLLSERMLSGLAESRNQFSRRKLATQPPLLRRCRHVPFSLIAIENLAKEQAADLAATSHSPVFDSVGATACQLP